MEDFAPAILAMQQLSEAFERFIAIAQAALDTFAREMPMLESEAAYDAERRSWLQADRDNYVRGQLRDRFSAN